MLFRSVVSSKLLLAAKSLHSDPTAPNAKNLLAQAARNVTESINSLIGKLLSKPSIVVTKWKGAVNVVPIFMHKSITVRLKFINEN